MDASARLRHTLFLASSDQSGQYGNDYRHDHPNEDESSHFERRPPSSVSDCHSQTRSSQDLSRCVGREQRDACPTSDHPHSIGLLSLLSAVVHHRLFPPVSKCGEQSFALSSQHFLLRHFRSIDDDFSSLHLSVDILLARVASNDAQPTHQGLATTCNANNHRPVDDLLHHQRRSNERQTNRTSLTSKQSSTHEKRTMSKRLLCLDDR